jgi:regulator of protease activity HflC (stomatin/prohibitin superfamily)
MKMKSLMMAAILAMSMSGCECQYVEPGNVGLKVNLIGDDKGMDQKELSPGRYYIGYNERLYTFPMFEQNVSWTASKEDDGQDESFTFQVGKVPVNADFAISFNIEPGKASTIFQTYRKGLPEIADGPLRNAVRDALQDVPQDQHLTVDDVVGEKKGALTDEVEKRVRDMFASKGIRVIKLSLLGRIRLPDEIQQTMNAQIKSTQLAIQRENELREAEAEAKKKVATAEGAAKEAKAIAEGRASAILTEAEAQAKANRLLAESLTPALVELKKLEKWNGQLPQFGGSSGGGQIVPVITLQTR